MTGVGEEHHDGFNFDHHVSNSLQLYTTALPPRRLLISFLYIKLTNPLRSQIPRLAIQPPLHPPLRQLSFSIKSPTRQLNTPQTAYPPHLFLVSLRLLDAPSRRHRHNRSALFPRLPRWYAKPPLPSLLFHPSYQNYNSLPQLTPFEQKPIPSTDTKCHSSAAWPVPLSTPNNNKNNNINENSAQPSYDA